MLNTMAFLKLEFKIYLELITILKFHRNDKYCELTCLQEN